MASKRNVKKSFSDFFLYNFFNLCLWLGKFAPYILIVAVISSGLIYWKVSSEKPVKPGSEEVVVVEVDDKDVPFIENDELLRLMELRMEEISLEDPNRTQEVKNELLASYQRDVYKQNHSARNLVLNSTCEKIKELGLVKRPNLFCKRLKKKIPFNKSMVTGEYEISYGMTLDEVVETFAEGKVKKYRVEVENGATMKEIVDLLVARNIVNYEDMLRALSSKELFQLLPLRAKSVEGFFAPGVYYFSKNSEPIKVLKAGIDRRLEELKSTIKDLDSKMKLLDLNTEEVLALGSIIEKEATHTSQRRKVAGCYLNLIKIGFPFLSIEALRFEHKDLNKDNFESYKRQQNIYNTFLNPELPKVAICSASNDSIQAIFEAEKSNCIYFLKPEDNSDNYKYFNTYEDYLEAKGKNN